MPAAPAWLSWFGWGLVVALAGLVLVNSVAAFRHLDDLLPIRPGRPAQNFDMPTLNGDRVRLSDLRGRPVLLVFWSIYCGVCHRELTALRGFTKRHPELTILAIHAARASRSDIRDKVEELELDVPVLLDSGAVAAAYGVRQFPELVLVDPRGRVARIWVGYTPRSEIAAALRAVGPRRPATPARSVSR